MRFWDEKAAKILFQELQFYNVLIEKPRIKRLKNIDLMRELPFYDEYRKHLKDMQEVRKLK